MKLPILNIERLKEVASKDDRRPNGDLKNSVLRARKIIEILKRDKFSCVECKNKHDLTIDHTNGRDFAEYDNHQKYRLEGCVTLCEKCHLKKNISKWKTKNV